MAGGGESRKWMILVATTWIQAFTGTNLDFSSYSSNLKSALGISQVQLNYLAVASDMGKLFGWCSGLCLFVLPTWIVLFIAAFMGLVGYGFQWLLIHHLIVLPYFLVVDNTEVTGIGAVVRHHNVSNYGKSFTLRTEEGFCGNVLFRDRLVVLGEEHSTSLLIRRWDFWLYFFAYLFGGTIGLVYSNNLGQISQSLGYDSDVSTLVSIYSAFSFFGRLLSTTPVYLQNKMYYARTGWFALALVPTPMAFLLLVLSGSKTTLITSTAMIGLSSGFVFSAAVSITSELFGPNRAGVNHNILITNIPIGSLLCSLFAALVYEANTETSSKGDKLMVCTGRSCYHQTFIWWWLISLIGLFSSSMLFVRTKAVYNCSEKTRNDTQIVLSSSVSAYERT